MPSSSLFSAEVQAALATDGSFASVDQKVKPTRGFKGVEVFKYLRASKKHSFVTPGKISPEDIPYSTNVLKKKTSKKCYL